MKAKQSICKEISLTKLIECQKSDDTEFAHEAADDVLCELLESLGYGDIVVEYRNVPRWFA
jgi:hypothetical protein